jgi:hypothetical protein
MQGIEARFPGRPARSLATVPTEQSRLRNIQNILRLMREEEWADLEE